MYLKNIEIQEEKNKIKVKTTSIQLKVVKILILLISQIVFHEQIVNKLQQKDQKH